MKQFSVFILFATTLTSVVPSASGGPAQIWLSASATVPGNPGQITVPVPQGISQPLYIWARPATEGTNLRTMDGFTLNVATLAGPVVQTDNNGFPAAEPQPFVDFLDGTFMVENSVAVGSPSRFQTIADSFRAANQGGPIVSSKASGEITFESPDEIRGLAGLSPLASPVTTGIGNASEPIPFRVGSGNAAAWRLGKFSFTTLRRDGSNYLYLQLGYQGMRHLGDQVTLECIDGARCTTGTEVTFGGGTTIYNAHNFDQRQTSFAGEGFDVKVVSVPRGDYSRNGIVGPEDAALWRTTFGQMVLNPGDGADGNSSGFIDAGDYVLWRNQLAQASGAAVPLTSSGAEVPEPGTLILSVVLFFTALLSSYWRVKISH